MKLEGNGKIAMAIPLERFLINQFLYNIEAIVSSLYQTGHGMTQGRFYAEGHRVDRNRDMAIDWFLPHEEKPEWLLFLDSDMEHPFEVGSRLAAWGKPIVGGLYFHRASHMPHVYKRGYDTTDSYGQEVHRWVAQDVVVYDWIEKTGVPMMDGALAWDTTDALFECDAVGTGSLIVHRSVLESMEPPWFRYFDGNMSEDLQFCLRAQKMGLPIYADLSTQSGHYNVIPTGQAQFRQTYLKRGMHMSSYGYHQAANSIGKYLDIDATEAMERITTYKTEDLSSLWNGVSSTDAAAVLDFYKREDVGTAYLYDLIHWNMSQAFFDIRARLVGATGKNVLEIGAGIGTVAMQMLIQGNDVTAQEVNDFLRGYALQRWQEFTVENDRLPLGMLHLSDDPVIEAHSYDLVIAIDVFEHLPGLELGVMVGNVAAALKPGGRLFTHNNWGQQDIYPMHYKNGDVFPEMLRSRGFTVLDEYWAIYNGE